MYTAPYHHVRNYTLQPDSWTDQQSSQENLCSLYHSACQDYRFDSGFVFCPDSFEGTADGIFDLIAVYFWILFPFQSDGSGTAGAASDGRSSKADGLQSRSGSYVASFISFYHVGVQGSIDETLLISIRSCAAFVPL